MSLKRNLLIAPLGLLSLTVLSGAFLMSSYSHADDSTVDNINITVPVSCSLEGTGMTSHNANMMNGTYQNNIGTTTMKAYCNDNNGFSIYAIGYSDDTYGETHLSSSADPTYNIATGTATSGDTSNWAMKLSTPTSPTPTYPLTIDSDTNGSFSSYHIVPSNHTKVAHRDSATDIGTNAEGSTLTSTYAAFVSLTQPAGTYTGKVLYTLVHPVDKRPAIPYTINYNKNTTASVSNLPSPNPQVGMTSEDTVDIFDNLPTRNGYAFKGWCTVEVADDATCTGTTYNPDGRRINLALPIDHTKASNTITLHAVWEKAALLDTGQNVNQKLKRLAGNSSATYSTTDNTITALTRANSLPSGFTPTSNNTISTSSSISPIYAWFDSGTIYYYSDVSTIMMNKSSSNFFYNMRALSDLSTISSWNTSSVTDMSYMFSTAGYNVTTFNLNLSSWNTSSVTSIKSLFASAGYNATTWSVGDLSSWDTSSMTDMSGTFYSAGRNTTTWSVGDLSSWDTSSVTSMSNMFDSAGYSATTWSVGDLSSWDTSSVTNMSSMFNSAGLNATIWSAGDLSSWDTSSVTNMFFMFYCTGYSTTSWSIGDLSSWDTSNVTNMSNMFVSAGYRTTSWSIGDLSSWDTSSVTNMSSMFNSAGYNTTTWSVGDLSSWNTSSVTSMSSMFSSAGYNATSWSIGDLSSWDTSSVTSMYNMFYYAGYNATTFNLNLSSWNTSSVTNMSSMFRSAGYSATSWSIGDLSSWDTSSVTNMFFMFDSAGYNATSWSIGDISSWNTSSVTSMSSMFSYTGYNANTFNLNLSSWNTSSVTNMSDMFRNAGYNATTFTLNLSSWDTSSVTNMNNMFYLAGYSATAWSVTIPKTNNGTTTGPITNTTTNLYGNSTSVTAIPPSGRSFTLAN